MTGKRGDGPHRGRSQNLGVGWLLFNPAPQFRHVNVDRSSLDLFRTCALSLQCRGVDPEVAQLNRIRIDLDLSGSSVNRFYTSQHFLDGKGLRNVVIGAEAQARDDVLLGSLCREHDDRLRPICAPDSIADLKSVHLGKHEVQEDHVEPARSGSFQRPGPARSPPCPRFAPARGKEESRDPGYSKTR